eukprot:4271190-Pleurochrysis_carterae.AAC.1
MACVSVRCAQVHRTRIGRTRSRARKRNNARRGRAIRCTDCHRRIAHHRSGVDVLPAPLCTQQWLAR